MYAGIIHKFPQMQAQMQLKGRYLRMEPLLISPSLAAASQRGLIFLPNALPAAMNKRLTLVGGRLLALKQTSVRIGSSGPRNDDDEAEGLGWKRVQENDPHYDHASSAPDQISRSSGRGDAAIGNLGMRLKAHRIKALINKRLSHRNRGDDVKQLSVPSEKKARELSNNQLENDSGSSYPAPHSRTTSATRNKDLRSREASNSNFIRTVPGDASSQKDVARPLRQSASPPRSRGWGHSPPRPVDSRTSYATGDGFFSTKTFKELGCSNDLIEALKRLTYLRPSHIQAMSYTPVLEGKSCIVADQSGSGKTLAYLSPIIQSFKREEQLGSDKSLPNNPRVLILVPTAELASQVLNNCRSIAKCGVPFRSMVATGGFRQKTQLETLRQELDIIIGTPGRIMYLLKEGFLELNRLKSVVLDEVDILFGDDEFGMVLQSLIDAAPVATQYIFSTATLPIDIYNNLVQLFPDCQVIMGPGMHRTSSGLEEVLVDCSGEEGGDKSPDTAFLNKKTALLQLVEEMPVPKTIVFCNKIETCRKVENVLKRFDRKGVEVRTLPFHAAIDQQTRISNMKDFLNSRSNESLFFVCTDRASRGIDFEGVDHVILFDFPRDPSEYVRRVGRTARGAGGRGKAFVFVVGKQVPLAWKIIERNKKGHPVHDTPSAYY